MLVLFDPDYITQSRCDTYLNCNLGENESDFFCFYHDVDFLSP